MTKSEYFKQHQKLMQQFGDENHPEIEALNNQRLNAIQVANTGLVDASNQTQQSQSSARVSDWSADKRERAANRKLLQDKADNLEAQGKAMAQFNHFFGAEE